MHEAEPSAAGPTGALGARPAAFLMHSGSTSIGDDDLYVHLFRGGRITVAGASGRVWLQGQLAAVAPIPRVPASIRYTTTDGAAMDVPFPSADVARIEARAAEQALRAPGAVLGDGQHDAQDLPPSPALPSARPPLAAMLAAPLKHITQPPASPEIALHLLRALRAIGRAEEAGESAAAGPRPSPEGAPKPRSPAQDVAFPAGYIEVDLPDHTWVLYRDDDEDEDGGPASEARPAGGPASEARPAGGQAASFAILGGEPSGTPRASPPEGAAKPAKNVYAVPGPLPMLVWRRGRPPSPQDRMALMERLRAAAAPLMRSWADPVLCPPVPPAGAAVF
jgi:hypothetical protein